jgi:hypothetical protein
MSQARDKGADIDEVVNKTPITKMSEKFYSFFLVFGGFAISVLLVQNMKYIYVHYSFNYPLWLSMTHQLAAYLVALVAIYGFNIVPERRVLNMNEQLRLVVPFSIMGTLSL